MLIYPLFRKSPHNPQTPTGKRGMDREVSASQKDSCKHDLCITYIPHQSIFSVNYFLHNQKKRFKLFKVLFECVESFALPSKTLLSTHSNDGMLKYFLAYKPILSKVFEELAFWFFFTKNQQKKEKKKNQKEKKEK